jgi:hypothetical protein
MTPRTIDRKRRFRPISPHSSRTESRARTAIDSALWWVVAGTAAFTPVFISLTGRDEFRAPKEYFLRGGSILVMATLAIRWLYSPHQSRHELSKYRAATLTAAAVVIWTAITTAFSTNTALSLWTLLYVVLCAGFFVGTMIVVNRRSVAAIYILLAPGVINTALLLLQASNVWDPIYGSAELRAPSAFVGSTNDVGAHLIAPAIASAALVFASRNRKGIHIAAAVFLFIGILAARSATAIGAYAIAVMTIGAVLSWRKALALVGATALVITLGFAIYPPLRQRVVTVRNAVITRDYNLLLSYRLEPFMNAMHMFLHHPVTGVGPGCYAWNYFDYKIAAEQRYPILRKPGDHRIFMFGEAHSDHLQILAVSGLPGYLLFLGSVIVLGKGSWTRRGSDASDRQRFANLCSLPLAAGVATIALAQFPLELAASTVSLLYSAAICLSWNARENP